MRVLTIFSAFFMPLTFIVGIYGMNFEFMPELSSPIGYPAVWAIMIAITAGIYAWFRVNGWVHFRRRKKKYYFPA
jgi:magnesium transporter